jgi:hypothetical protein
LFRDGSVQSKTFVGNTFEKDGTEMGRRKAYKYLGIEESHDTQHKNRKGKLKKKYFWRMSLVLDAELMAPGIHSFTEQAELCYRGPYNP